MSQKKINLLIAILFILLIVVLFSNRIIKINGPSTASVIFKPFSGGIETHYIYNEGVFCIWPWNTAYQFSLAEQLVDTTINILMKNGVTANVQINYRFWPESDCLPVIFRKYGINYKQIFVAPEVESATREEISDYTPEELYTAHFDSIRINVINKAKRRLKLGNINLEDLVVLHIDLPKKVTVAIENKLAQQQLMLEYDYKDSIAEKEKNIKIIEASAIKIAEDTINRGLTPEYLQLRQIEAFEKLSQSANAKTIVIPRSSTPVLFNGQ